MLSKFIYCLLFILSTFSHVFAVERDIYSWKEPKGTINFADIPPNGISTKKIIAKPSTGKSKVSYDDVQTKQTQKQNDSAIENKVQENPKKSTESNFLTEQQKENHKRNCERVKQNKEALASTKNPANPSFHQKLVEQKRSIGSFLHRQKVYLWAQVVDQ